MAALFKVQTEGRWTCQNLKALGQPCKKQNLIEERNQTWADEVGMRIQCGKFERKQGESEEEYHIRSIHVRSLDEIIHEKMNEDVAVAAILTCPGCGVKKARCPVEYGVISSPEALIIKLDYFEIRKGLGYKPSQLRVKYGLWLDLSRFQSPDHRRKRKSFRYRLSSVLFHAGRHNKTGHWLGIHSGPTGIFAVSDHDVSTASIRDMLTTAIDEEAAFRLWKVDSKTFASWGMITPVGLVYVRV